MKELSSEFYSIIEERLPMYYCLHRYGRDKKLADVNKICPSIRWLQWAGGEFIGGTSDFFSSLYKEIILFVDRYWSNLNANLFHIGDEMLTTIAIAKLREKKIIPIDAGALGFIYRYWSVFERCSFQDIGASLVHLPGDKKF